mmetsp:Transcript_38516/g.87524  ORF Transcript_38516/g.87524 Transcript_38516/m.87524 type:complete len:346 (+) Transcript_38516:643-1680(+)
MPPRQCIRPASPILHPSPRRPIQHITTYRRPSSRLTFSVCGALSSIPIYLSNAGQLSDRRKHSAIGACVRMCNGRVHECARRALGMHACARHARMRSGASRAPHAPCRLSPTPPHSNSLGNRAAATSPAQDSAEVARHPPRAVLAVGTDQLIELVSIVTNRVLDIVVDRNPQRPRRLRLLAGGERLHKRMRQRLLDGHSRLGVELQHEPNHVHRLWRGARHHRGEIFPFLRLDRFEHGLRKFGLNARNLLSIGDTSDLKDPLKLVHGAAAIEDGLAAEHLSDDAAQSPHIDSEGVRGGSQDDLWRAVPARHYIVSEDGGLVTSRDSQRARKSKVGHFAQALLVEE